MTGKCVCVLVRGSICLLMAFTHEFRACICQALTLFTTVRCPRLTKNCLFLSHTAVGFSFKLKLHSSIPGILILALHFTNQTLNDRTKSVILHIVIIITVVIHVFQLCLRATDFSSLELQIFLIIGFVTFELQLLFALFVGVSVTLIVPIVTLGPVHDKPFPAYADSACLLACMC